MNGFTREIIGAAIEMHHELGPGLLASIYEECLVFELQSRGVGLGRQAALPIVYQGRPQQSDCRPDRVVEDALVAEIKAVDKVLPVHEAQLLTCLKSTRLPAPSLSSSIVRHCVKALSGY